METYIKALRKEAYLMMVNVATVIIGGVLSLFTAYVLNNITITILVIDFVVALKCILLEREVVKAININVTKDIIWENIMAVLFVCFNWYISGATGFVLYFICFIVYLWAYRNHIKKVKELIIGYN